MLDELIADSSDSAFERATLPVGIESKLAKVNWKTRDVLVGTLKQKEDLNICLDNDCYFIPASRIDDDNLPVHYVAIYQTKALFGSEAQIFYYGEVKSTRLVKQNDLPGMEGDGEELYFRFNIKEWKQLNKAIAPKERGSASMFTNYFLLTHSSEVPELFLKSEEEYRFFHELKRRTDAAIINEEETSSGFELGNNKVLFDEGNIILNVDGIEIERQTIRDFSKRPNAVFRLFMNKLNEE